MVYYIASSQAGQGSSSLSLAGWVVPAAMRSTRNTECSAFRATNAKNQSIADINVMRANEGQSEAVCRPARDNRRDYLGGGY